MSGEVVIAPALPLAVVPLATAAVGGIVLYGVGIGAVGVGKIVKGIVDKHVETATQKMELERARIREWRSYQEKQRLQMHNLMGIQKSIAESEERLSAVTLTEGFNRRVGEGPTAKGYASIKKIKKSQDEAISTLNNVFEILNDLPAEFLSASDSPYPRLLKQKIRLGQKPRIDITEVESFKEIILRTMASYMHSLEMTARQKAALAQRLESFFNEVLVCSHLTSGIKHINELDSIKANLLTIMNSDNILIGQVELLEERFKEIKAEIEFSLSNTAFRSTLTESMIRNLEDMGYESIEAFPADASRSMLQATVKMPGGERLRIAIQQNNKISFQVCHEGDKMGESISREEINFFRQQEKQWCQDLLELIRRLTAEGFVYNISLERLIPEMSIPIAVVETVDEILSQREEEEDMRRLYEEPKQQEMS